MSSKKIELGDKVKDVVSGFTGIVIAKTEWMNRCVRITVQPQSLTKEGKTRDSEAFDIEQLILIKPQVVKPKPIAAESNRTGGPMPAVTRRADVRRHS